MKSPWIAVAAFCGLLLLSPGRAGAGLASDLLDPVAAEMQARLDGLTGDLDRRERRQQAALEKGLAAVGTAALTDGIGDVARAARTVDQVLRKAYREEFVLPGSAESPLPVLSRDLCEALHAEVAREHWAIVSRMAGAMTPSLSQYLVKGAFGKVRGALLAAGEALDGDDLPRAFKKLASAAAGIAPWTIYVDAQNLPGVAAFLGSKRLTVEVEASCAADPVVLDLTLGVWDPVSSILDPTGTLHIEMPAVPGPAEYAIAPGDATWRYDGDDQVWTNPDAGWLLVVEGAPGATPFGGVFECDLTDGKRTLKVRYGAFHLECAPAE
jgi:hypothetical protein